MMEVGQGFPWARGNWLPGIKEKRKGTYQDEVCREILCVTLVQMKLVHGGHVNKIDN